MTDERIDGLITFWPGKNVIFTIRVVSHPYLDLASPIVKAEARENKKKKHEKKKENWGNELSHGEN